MDLSKILAISGRPGLFQMITETKNGFIVESLTDHKRFPVFANVRVSSMEEISIYATGEDDLSLREVFKAINEKTEGKQVTDVVNDSAALKAFFLEAIPDYDEEKVYVSDMKKVISWYNILLELDMLDFSEEEEEEGGSTEEETEAEDTEAEDTEAEKEEETE